MSWLPLVLGAFWLGFVVCALVVLAGRKCTTVTPKVRVAATLGATLLFVAIAVFALTKTGVINGGREHWTTSSGDFSNTRAGYSMGSKQVYARAGQSLEVDYAIVSGRGTLLVWVQPRAGLLGISIFNDPPLWQRSMKTVGRFKESVLLPAAGLYNLHISVLPEKGGSLTHEVVWKVK